MLLNGASAYSPDFVKEIKTSWNFKRGEKVEYKLPQLKDAEGNDKPIVIITPTEGQEFPGDGLRFNNNTNTLSFDTDKFPYWKSKFYFNIVAAEHNSP